MGVSVGNNETVLEVLMMWLMTYDMAMTWQMTWPNLGLYSWLCLTMVKCMK